MRREQIPIVNKLGLHARASAKLVELARRFQCTVSLSKDHDTVDGKSILGILMLAAACGETVELQTQGTDEIEAAEAIRDLFQRRFDEDE
jgi:phosphocarrier protein